MVPLAHALQAAGHRVAFATDPGFCAYVRAVGFEAFPAGLNQGEARARFVAATPGWADIPPADQMSYQQPGLFGRVRVPPMLDDLAGIIAGWRPDLIIHDSVEMAGAIAAEASGIAHAEHSFGILRPAAVRRLATDALAPISDALGVRNPGVGGINGELYLDICPPGIQHHEITDVPNVQRLQPLGFDAAPDARLPDWIGGLPERPTVYVTLGTVFNSAADVFRTVLEGVRDEPINLIVTVGENGDPAALGPQPSNVRVERYIPQSQLLPHCELFISHAGSGALLGALNAGVPMLAIPQGADQFMNAERIVATGLGLRLMPSEMSPGAVRDSVKLLIGDRRYASAARAQRAAIDEMPTPRSVVPVLEALVN
jgi:UDP:flavonoid glycosyltransferase YjiC (YdhE family)